MAKVSKNARVNQRATKGGTGKDYVKVVKPVKDPITGKYSYKTQIIHKDKTKEFFSSK